MAYRRTLRRDVGCTGIGLHTGRPTKLRLRPAPAGHGVRFRRVDVGVEIPASIENLAHLDHATTLQHRGVTVSTVEHLLSALSALGVDDVLVDVDGPEVPILDGSAAPFVILIHEAGLRPLPVARQYLKILAPVEVVRGGKSVRLSPADQFRVSYAIGFDHPLLRHQATECRVTAESYAEEIAPARTFGFLRDVEMLRRAGLALGGSLDNAIVIGETGVLNNKLRFEDEFVRHKVLDAIGDLALLGHPVVGHLEAARAGHALHAALAQKLVVTPEAWTLVTHPQFPVVGGATAAAGALEPRTA
jgi:UDP-3-O-[3-hydroxymyristoyl] N-acetylglucosamine deacetylase